MLTIFLIILISVSLSVNYFLIRGLLLSESKLEVYESWIQETRDHATEIYNNLKIVDEKQIFEKDDDVGFVFSEIISLVNELNNKISDEIDETE